ncbi:hypothetical protein A0H81_11636 [Grifola frondosa]|uniref:MYND-type domain-containing protein n=1 Tax=Grifola frondosa TaxID=5627 RepID=A0A1C7M089_GRIFR|nr:hypothetical protein A0H81_11636 [Grifola frondosa]
MADDAPCQFCFEPAGTLQCSKCKAARYCSTAHSVSDWQRHKPECNLLSTVGLKGQNGYPFTVKAVLFPADGDTPRIVDVRYKLRQVRDVPTLQHDLDLGSWVGSGPDTITIQKSGVNGPPLGRSIMLMYNGNFFNDGSPLNRSIQRLAGGRCHPWGGHMLGFRYTDPSAIIARYEDVKTEDVEVFKKYFREGGTGQSIREYFRLSRCSFVARAEVPQ